MLYRQLDVKQKLDAGMTDDEAYSLLASDGMLVKRPLLIVDGVPATPGFREADWAAALAKAGEALGTDASDGAAGW